MPDDVFAPDSHAQSRARIHWRTSVNVSLSLSPHRVPSRQSCFSLLSVLTRTIFVALPICRYSGHPRRHLPPPRLHASIFSSLSWQRPRERAYHVPRR